MITRLINFIQNAWYFRSELCQNKGDDYIYSLTLFNKSLKKLHGSMRDHKSNLFLWDKRIEKINEVTSILDRIAKEDYMTLAYEITLEEFKQSAAYQEEITSRRPKLSKQDPITDRLSEINRAIKISNDMEKNDWIRLWTILKSRDYGLRSWWI